MAKPKNNFLLNLTALIATGLLVMPPVFALSDQVRSMCRQAEALIGRRQFGQAIKLLKRAEKMEPNCGEVHGYLGMAYQNSLKTQKAISEYERALKLNPSMSFVNVNLGTCYMNLNRLDKATPYFQAYLRANPNAPDRAQVESYIRQAGARTNQNNLRSIMEQGQALLNRGQSEQAAQAFQQVVSMKPGWAPGHFFLAYARAKMGNHSEAIKEFQIVLKIDPSKTEAILNIGSNYQSMGDPRSAITWYQRYLQAVPNSPKSRDIKNRIKGLEAEAKKNPNRNFNRPPRPAFNTTQNPQVQQPRLQQQPQQYNQPVRQVPQQVDSYITNASSNGRFFRWPPQAMPVRVYIANGSGINSYRPEFNRILKEAFSKWSKASFNRLSFAFVPSPNNANIVCFWTNNANQIMELGRAVEGGLTKISGQPAPGGASVNIARAKMTILTKPRNNTDSELSDDDMMKVCLHEVGHALGISGHSNNNKDIMFYSESPSIWPALTKRDKATIRQLYSR